MSDKFKKLKIISEGLPHTAKVIDEDGNVIEGITNVEIELNATSLPKAIITIEGIVLDIEIPEKQIDYKSFKLCTACNPHFKEIAR